MVGGMTPHDRVLSYIRTFVPYGIGALLAWVLTTVALDLRGEFELALTAFLVALVTNVYYLLIRFAESRAPWLGVLLGWPKMPDYTAVDNLWASLVRTGIPTLVAPLVVLVAAWLAGLLNITLTDELTTGLIAAVIGIVEAAYYALARFLIKRWPSTEWLLGVSARPTYVVGT